jgi:deoxyribodipyrimidine photo-lyase
MRYLMQDSRFNLIHSAPYKSEGPVLYWLQHTQRIDQNYALYKAIEIANELNKPLQVLFILNPNYPESNLRHFQFMLEGIETLFNNLETLGIEAMMVQGEFKDAS